jgi:hypothetical protein
MLSKEIILLQILIEKSPPLTNFSYFNVYSTNEDFEKKISDIKIIINKKKCPFESLSKILNGDDPYILDCFKQSSIDKGVLLQKINNLYDTKKNEPIELITMINIIQKKNMIQYTYNYNNLNWYNEINSFMKEYQKTQILNHDTTELPFLTAIYIDDIKNGIVFINATTTETKEINFIKEKQYQNLIEYIELLQNKKDLFLQYNFIYNIYEIIKFIDVNDKSIIIIKNIIESLNKKINECYSNKLNEINEINEININTVIKDKKLKNILKHNKHTIILFKKNTITFTEGIYANVVLICFIYYMSMILCNDKKKKVFLEEFEGRILSKTLFIECINEIKENINKWNIDTDVAAATAAAAENQKKIDAAAAENQKKEKYKKYINLLKTSKHTKESLFPKLREKIIGLLEKINTTDEWEVKKIQMLEPISDDLDSKFPFLKGMK